MFFERKGVQSITGVIGYFYCFLNFGGVRFLRNRNQGSFPLWKGALLVNRILAIANYSCGRGKGAG